MKSKERIAIVPGSFDPITKGHLSIILKAAKDYDKVFVAVMINANKKYMFNIEQRTKIAQKCVENISNVSVISSEGWLWELARDLGACAIVKGYRNDADIEYEKEMAAFNEARYPEAKTVLIKSDKALSQVSSTEVRNRINSNQSIGDIVPEEAIDLINAIIKKPRN